MRVITGSARGVALKAPKGMDTRPTMDQVKEGIFSAIQFEVEGRRVLDLFAGSGQMGIEALSRGAEYGGLCRHARGCLQGHARKSCQRRGWSRTRGLSTLTICSYLAYCPRNSSI